MTLLYVVGHHSDSLLTSTRFQLASPSALTCLPLDSNDPLYLGLRRSRIRGQDYDDFVGKFCDTVRECYKDAFLHFEDFGVTNAGRILSKYREKQSCFNDDMQGTAAVVLSALMSACKVTKSELKDQRICVFGFGSSFRPLAPRLRLEY